MVVKVNLTVTNEVRANLSSFFRSRSLSDSSHKKCVVYLRYLKPALNSSASDTIGHLCCVIMRYLRRLVKERLNSFTGLLDTTF